MINAIVQRIRQGLLSAGVGMYGTEPEGPIKEVLAKTRPVATECELVRIGGAGDGGYLLPNDLQGIKYCFSPGVLVTSTFEQDLAARGIRSYLADYSVDKPPIASEMFVFDKKYLGAFNDDVYFTLGAWINKYVPQNDCDMILQMDIEGSEYPVLCETPESVLQRFRIIVIEFHDLDRLFEKNFLRIYTAGINRLTRYFHCVHIHPNNCTPPVRRGNIEIPPVMEFTFLRKDRTRVTNRRLSFPHPLDADNVILNRPLHLPRCWQL